MGLDVRVEPDELMPRVCAQVLGDKRGRIDTRAKALDDLAAPPLLKLRMGCQVMLTKNLDDELINGSTGKVIGFCTRRAYQEDVDDRWVGPNAFGLPLDHNLLGSQERPEPPKKRAKREKFDDEIEFPVVRFMVNENQTRDRLMSRVVVRAEWPDGKLKASREQIPLTLAWALNIHKSQGQSELICLLTFCQQVPDIITC